MAHSTTDRRARRHGRLAVTTVVIAATLAALGLASGAPAAGPNYTCADAPPPSGAPAGTPPGGDSFAFAAGGDMGCSPDAAATLEGIRAAGVDFALHFGDMAYDQIYPESSWCDFIKDPKNGVGPDFPYETLVRLTRC